MSTPLTLMAVHAHPDDESSSTGGVLARYADDGVRTVVVTCTNGELGDAPGGIKPGDAGHGEAEGARSPIGGLGGAGARRPPGGGRRGGGGAWGRATPGSRGPRPGVWSAGAEGARPGVFSS